MNEVATRTWGDGVGDQRPHVIEDISYTGYVFIQCRCGLRLVANSADGLATEWRRHGGQVFSGNFAPRDESDLTDWTAVDHESAVLAMRKLAELGAQCTCGMTPVAQCPNYLPGDEE